MKKTSRFIILSKATAEAEMTKLVAILVSIAMIPGLLL